MKNSRDPAINTGSFFPWMLPQPASAAGAAGDPKAQGSLKLPDEV